MTRANSKRLLDCGGRFLDLDRTVIMGVLNVTPDSFSDGGRYTDVDSALAHARAMAGEGAEIIDVGGESTRPGAEAVSVQQELDRVIPVIERIVSELDVAVSIDTSKPEIMRDACAAGAGFVNDVFALRQPGALEAVAALGVPVCLMHMQGEPRSMQDDPQYVDVVEEVYRFLAHGIEVAEKAGIGRERIVIDPGFGFGKSVEHNLTLLRRLGRLQALGAPVLVGLSRKSMIGKLLDLPVDRRVHASVALGLLAVQQGACILRVHDVAETVQAVRMLEAVYKE